MYYTPNEAVITTQSIIDGAMITCVFYNEEESDNEESINWEFYPNDDWKFEDLRLVAIEEIIMKAPELKSIISKMSDNEAAFYDFSSKQWKIVPYDYSSSRRQ